MVLLLNYTGRFLCIFTRRLFAPAATTITPTMAAVTYRDGIAILQLIIFPVILVAGILIWKRVGWRAGGKTWRFVVTLSLLRIIGSICTLLTINNDEERIYIAAAVCELIGIAPLLLTYVGLMRQM